MNWPLYWVAMILFVVSLAFNELVGLVNIRTKGVHPLAAAEVALGTIYTLGGVWLVDGDCISIWTLLFCFVASGTPMIAGDVFRWLGRVRQ